VPPPLPVYVVPCCCCCCWWWWWWYMLVSGVSVCVCVVSDRPLQTMLDELKRLKEEYPDRILIASIMEEYNK